MYFDFNNPGNYQVRLPSSAPRRARPVKPAVPGSSGLLANASTGAAAPAWVPPQLETPWWRQDMGKTANTAGVWDKSYAPEGYNFNPSGMPSYVNPDLSRQLQGALQIAQNPSVTEGQRQAAQKRYEQTLAQIQQGYVREERDYLSRNPAAIKQRADQLGDYGWLYTAFADPGRGWDYQGTPATWEDVLGQAKKLGLPAQLQQGQTVEDPRLKWTRSPTSTGVPVGPRESLPMFYQQIYGAALAATNTDPRVEYSYDQYGRPSGTKTRGTTATTPPITSMQPAEPAEPMQPAMNVPQPAQPAQPMTPFNAAGKKSKTRGLMAPAMGSY